MHSEPDESNLNGDTCSAAIVASVIIYGIEDAIFLVDHGTLTYEVSKNRDCMLLHARVTAGDWAERKSDEPKCLRPVYNMRSRLSSFYMTYTRKLCLLILTQLRMTCMASYEFMIRRAMQMLYWPGIDPNVSQKRVSCRTCETQQLQLDIQVSIAYTDRLTGWVDIENQPH